MQSVDAISERILYWLSLDVQVRALAERLLERFGVTAGDLPASAALKVLEELEGNMTMERRDGARVRPSRRAGGAFGRSGYDIPANEIEAGMELHLPCQVKVGQGNNGYKNIQEFLPDAAQ